MTVPQNAIASSAIRPILIQNSSFQRSRVSEWQQGFFFSLFGPPSKSEKVHILATFSQICRVTHQNTRILALNSNLTSYNLTLI